MSRSTTDSDIRFARVACAARRFGLVAGLCASFAGSAFAAEGVLPADVVAALVRKVAPYERGYAARAADGFVIAVVFAPASDASRLEKDLVVRALSERMPAARVVAVSDESLENEEGIDLIVLCEGVDLDETSADAAKRGVLTIGLRTEHVENIRGAAMAFVPRAGKPRILVNLKAAGNASLDIDARLLGLAEIVTENAQASK